MPRGWYSSPQHTDAPRPMHGTDWARTDWAVFKAFLSAKNGEFAEANVDAGYLPCGGDAAAGGQRGVMILGSNVREESTQSLGHALLPARNTLAFRAPAASPSRRCPTGER